MAINTTYYMHNEASTDITGYKKLTTSSADVAEVMLAGSYLTGDSTPKVMLLASYATESGEPNIAGNLSGNWTSKIRITKPVNDIDIAGVITIKVYKRDSGGTETFLFQKSRGGITTKTTYSDTWASSGAIVATDRVVVKIYAEFTSIN